MITIQTTKEGLAMPTIALPVIPVRATVLYLGELATVMHGNAADDFGPVGTTINIRFNRNVSRRMSQQMDVYASSVLVTTPTQYSADNDDPYANGTGVRRK